MPPSEGVRDDVHDKGNPGIWGKSEHGPSQGHALGSSVKNSLRGGLGLHLPLLLQTTPSFGSAQVTLK